MAQIAKINNAVLWIDGTDFRNEVEEVTVKMAEGVNEEHNGLGMVAPVDIPMGLGKTEATIRFSSMAQGLDAIGSDYNTKRVLNLSQNVKIFNPTAKVVEEVPRKVIMTGFFKANGDQSYTQHNSPKPERMFNVIAIKIEFNGLTELELDTVTQKHIINGVDQLAKMRTNTGF